nr:cyclic di-GMP binding protein [Raoultella sp. NCTC 9187]
MVIGDDSTIDFSKYYHFITMPDLRVFANSGFPYSRMADLAETLVVVPKTPTEGQVATLLESVGGISAQTGLAAINIQIIDDGSQVKGKDADLLLIGSIPPALKDDTQINLLVEATKSWVKMPMRHYELPSIYPDDEARTPNTRADITSSGPMAAIIGFQSPYHDQRSVVALLADSTRGNELLNDALNDSGKRARCSARRWWCVNPASTACGWAMSIMSGICRGLNASGLRSPAIRCCWLFWLRSASCCWRGYCGGCCVSSAVVACTWMTSNP